MSKPPSAALVVARRLITAATLLVATGILTATAFVLWPLDARHLIPPSQPGVVITDRAGAVLRNARASDGSRFRWVALQEMSPTLLAAFVATEDRGFYAHHGIEPRAVARAARDNLLAARVVSGASTISMQAARLVARLPRGWSGKPRQLLWALRLESALTKDEILEQYLNRVPLGQGAVGVESAAQLYFGASASNVSLGQAALLAGLARAPSRDNPLVSETRARNRRALALKRLSARKFASDAEIARANSEPVRTAKQTISTVAATTNAPFAAPHFTSGCLGKRKRTRQHNDSQHARLWVAIRSESEFGTQCNNFRTRSTTRRLLFSTTPLVMCWRGRQSGLQRVHAARWTWSSRTASWIGTQPFVYALAFDRGMTAATVLDDISQSWQTPSDCTARATTTGANTVGACARSPCQFVQHSRVRLATAGGSGRVDYARNAGFASLTRSPEHYGLGSRSATAMCPLLS